MLIELVIFIALQDHHIKAIISLLVHQLPLQSIFSHLLRLLRKIWWFIGAFIWCFGGNSIHSWLEGGIHFHNGEHAQWDKVQHHYRELVEGRRSFQARNIKIYWSLCCLDWKLIISCDDATPDWYPTQRSLTEGKVFYLSRLA